MTVYLLYMASPVIMWVFMNAFKTKPIRDDKRWKKYYLIICGIIIALMIGLRDKGVGSSDTAFYFKNWEMMSRVTRNNLPQILKNVDLEYGYQVSVWILSHVFHDGQWALILSGFFFSLSVCIFVYRNSKNPVMSLLIFNCLGIFNFMVQGLRQAIAMSICLFAYEQCKNRKFIRFALLVVIASSFHASAIVFLIVYFLKIFKLDIKSFILFIILTLIGLQLLPYAFDIINVAINDRYDMTSASQTGGVVAILIYAVIIIFGLIFKDTSDKHYALFLYCTVVAAIAMLLRNSVNVIAERMSYYFAFGQIIVLPDSIEALNEPGIRMLINIITAVLCFGVAIYKASYSILIPYTFFWQC